MPENCIKKDVCFDYIDPGFSAKTWDKETGNYCFPQRFYDPRNIKWLSLDPIGIELMNPMERGKGGKMVSKKNYSQIESLNWFNYCGNNPIMYRDPEGLVKIESPLELSNDPDKHLGYKAEA